MLYQLLAMSGSDLQRHRTGLGVLIFISCASLAVATTGFLFHLQRFFRDGVCDSSRFSR